MLRLRGTGEACAEYLDKGSEVTVVGRMTGSRTPKGDNAFVVEPRVWQGNNGAYRSSFEMQTNRVIFGGKGGGASAPVGGIPGEGQAAEEEQIPF